MWHGIFHGSAKRDGRDEGHPAVDDDDFASYRRGYGNVGDGPTRLNANSPTLFANPFRSSSTGDMVPIQQMVRNGLDGTLLRSSELPNSLTQVLTPNNDPVFTAEVNAVSNAANYRHRDTDRNPYFRYSPISRLSSMTTTRSNVFAVWITIGFFEVEEITDAEHGGGPTASWHAMGPTPARWPMRELIRSSAACIPMGTCSAKRRASTRARPSATASSRSSTGPSRSGLNQGPTTTPGRRSDCRRKIE